MTALAQMHVARKQLGLDEDTYRDALQRATGKRSAADMTEQERRQAIQYFKGCGFVPAPGRKRAKLAGQYAPKLQALWIAGWNLGLVRDRSDKAMLAFVKRQTGIDHVRFLRDQEDAMKAIEALKGWLERAGVYWGRDVKAADWTQDSGYRIAWAQSKLLDLQGRGYADLSHWLIENGYRPAAQLAGPDWHGPMNALGQHVRREAARKGGADLNRLRSRLEEDGREQ